MHPQQGHTGASQSSKNNENQSYYVAQAPSQLQYPAGSAVRPSMVPSHPMSQGTGAPMPPMFYARPMAMQPVPFPPPMKLNVTNADILDDDDQDERPLPRPLSTSDDPTQKPLSSNSSLQSPISDTALSYHNTERHSASLNTAQETSGASSGGFYAPALASMAPVAGNMTRVVMARPMAYPHHGQGRPLPVAPIEPMYRPGPMMPPQGQNFIPPLSSSLPTAPPQVLPPQFRPQMPISMYPGPMSSGVPHQNVSVAPNGPPPVMYYNMPPQPSSLPSTSSLDMPQIERISMSSHSLHKRHSESSVSSAAKPSSQRASTTSLSTTSVYESMTLDQYRASAKKSNDPAFQYEFAKHLIVTAQNLKASSQNDAKTIRKGQEMLYYEAIKWIKKLASAGKNAHAEAQFFLAECYGNGSLGLSVDHEKAFNLYLQASKLSHPSSTYRAAVCFEVGGGTKRDAARAVQFYRKAAVLGDTAAMYKLGMVLLQGQLGVPKNPREAVNWLKRAAAQADETIPHALHELAALYEGALDESSSILPDPTYACELYFKAAQLGYAPSQFKLGFCYEYGHLKLPVDPRRSISWYTKAAEQGDPDAELALSGWYLTGSEGILGQSDVEAYLWARKAADQGLAKAEYAVGYYIENQIGVKCNPMECHTWYTRAASQGNKRAAERLEDLRRGNSVVRGHQSSRKGEWRNEKDARNGECLVM